MCASRNVRIPLIISFIAVFMYSNLFADEAAADCDELTIASQIVLGYLAGGAAFVVACAVAEPYEKETSPVLIAAMPTAHVLASAGTVYGIGQAAGCRGSFMWTLGGAVAAPIVGGIIGGIKEGNKDGIFVGSLDGFLLTPISATIAYHWTKKKNNPGKDEIIVPLMSILTPISATIAYHLTKEKNNPDKKEIVVPLMSMKF